MAKCLCCRGTCCGAPVTSSVTALTCAENGTQGTLCTINAIVPSITRLVGQVLCNQNQQKVVAVKAQASVVNTAAWTGMLMVLGVVLVVAFFAFGHGGE